MDNNQQERQHYFNRSLRLQLQHQLQQLPPPQQLQQVEEQQQQQLNLHGASTSRMNYSTSNVLPGYRFNNQQERQQLQQLPRPQLLQQAEEQQQQQLNLHGASTSRMNYSTSNVLPGYRFNNQQERQQLQQLPRPQLLQQAEEQQQLQQLPRPQLLQQAEEQQQQQLNLHGGSISIMKYSTSNVRPGYRFCPNEEELITCYLKPKIANRPLPFDGIQSVDLYRHSPEQLTSTIPSSGLWKVNEWYFFNPRNRKYARGTRPSRNAGDGHWKATGVERKISFRGQTIGYKKALDYYSGHQGCGKKTNWKMHEYRIDQTGSAPNRNASGEMNMQLDEWVLSKIYLSTRKGGDVEQQDAGESIMNANDDRDQTVQTNEAAVQIQNNNLVSPGPSTAHAFAWPRADEPSSSFQMFDQNNFFSDEGLTADFNNDMFSALENFYPTTSAAHAEPNDPILASSDFSDGCIYMEPIDGDIDEFDLSDMEKDCK